MTAAVSISAMDPAAPPKAISNDWLYCGIATGVLLVLYLLLQNPYWVPGGDSEVMGSVARNLLLGKHYTFNGQPCSISYPGWPWLLALAMKISPTFLFLKLLTMSCMLASLSIGYFICRRFAGPPICLAVILLSGTLSYVYELTFWLHSDALLCLTTSASILMAQRANEQRKPSYWLLATVVLLCIANVIARQAGLLNWILVGSSLVSGQLRPRLNRFWVTLAISAAMSVLTWKCVEHALKVDKETIAALKKFGDSNVESGDAIIVDTADKTATQTVTLALVMRGGRMSVPERVLNFGNWYSYLLWQPFRIGHSNNLVGVASLLVGTLVLGSLVVVAVLRGRAFGQWIFGSVIVLGFCLALWPKPNARYFVPMAPLIILAVFLFFQWAIEALHDSKYRVIPISLLATFVAALIICNGALYACDVWVARSGQAFYSRYEAGLNQDLISAAQWLNAHPTGEGQIAICKRYANMGTISHSEFGLRATSFLTNRAIVMVPDKYQKYGDPREYQPFLNWARSPEIGVKYFLYQPDVSPWRVFHFRMGWLQKWMTHSNQEPIDTGAGWRLYVVPPTGPALRVSVPPISGWPTRVPGL